MSLNVELANEFEEFSVTFDEKNFKINFASDEDMFSVQFVEQNTFNIAFQSLGAQGLKGDQGDPSPSFTFTQALPSTTWTINHNLGYNPVIDLFDIGGAKFVAESINTSLNQVVVTLNTALAGSARLV